jgi:hypothetical protein
MRKTFIPQVNQLEIKVIPSGILWSAAETPVEYGGGGEVGTWIIPKTNPFLVKPPSSVAG